MAGVPVLATGRFEGVVQDSVNGYLIEPFDADQFADRLDTLHADAGLWQRMSAAGEQCGRDKFGGAAKSSSSRKWSEQLVSPMAAIAAE